MELIMINETQLKVMLAPGEMDDLSIQDSNETRQALRTILQKAKARCGFDATNSRVYVQMYPGRKGGCELYVTKMEKREEMPKMRTGSTITEYRKYELEKRCYSGHIIYGFRELGQLLSTCACLRTSGYTGISSAWQDPSGGFYLSLDHETYFAGEHFGKLCPSSMYYYINEHCRLLCPDAVPILGALA